MPEAIDILEKVNTFYNDAFSHLVTLTLALLAFVGGFIPLVISHVQSRQFKRDHASHLAQLKTDVADAKKDLVIALEEKLDAERAKHQKLVEKLDTETRRRFAVAEGGVFHVQAGTQVTNKHFAHATESYANAADNFLDGGDERHAGRAIKRILEECLPKIVQKDFDVCEDLETTLQDLIKKLDKLDENGQYTDRVADLRRELTAAKNREPRK
jgi:uncharacterized membrane protein